MFDSLHEECGVFGIFENQTTTVAQTAYLGLCLPCSTEDRRVAALP